MKIEIPMPATDLNSFINLQRRSKYAGAGIKKRETTAAAKAIRKEMDTGKRFTWPARLRFTWHLPNRRRDPDNIAFMKKFILDGMQSAGFIENDNLKCIIGFVDEFRVDGRNTVEIEEIH